MKEKAFSIVRGIAKTTLLLCTLLILGYIGYTSYFSIRNRPYKVRVSNVTDSAFTVSWITDAPMTGVVYYGDKDNFLPGPLSWLGKSKAEDDRDVSNAQTDCVSNFNKEVAKSRDENFVVDASGFNCNDVEVEHRGRYYTHHVTVGNLDSDKEYYFRVGNGFISFKEGKTEGVGYIESEMPVVSEFKQKTLPTITKIGTPKPAYGTSFNFYRDNNGIITTKKNFDSIIFLKTFKEGDEYPLMSAVTNNDGGWSIDLANVRDAENNLVSTEGILLEFIPQVGNSAPGADGVKPYKDFVFPIKLAGNSVDDLEEVQKVDGLKSSRLLQELVSKSYAKTTCYDANSNCDEVSVTGACKPLQGYYSSKSLCEDMLSTPSQVPCWKNTCPAEQPVYMDKCGGAYPRSYSPVCRKCYKCDGSKLLEVDSDASGNCSGDYKDTKPICSVSSTKICYSCKSDGTILEREVDQKVKCLDTEEETKSQLDCATKVDKCWNKSCESVNATNGLCGGDYPYKAKTAVCSRDCWDNEGNKKTIHGSTAVGVKCKAPYPLSSAPGNVDTSMCCQNNGYTCVCSSAKGGNCSGNTTKYGSYQACKEAKAKEQQDNINKVLDKSFERLSTGCNASNSRVGDIIVGLDGSVTVIPVRTGGATMVEETDRLRWPFVKGVLASDEGEDVCSPWGCLKVAYATGDELEKFKKECGAGNEQDVYGGIDYCYSNGNCYQVCKDGTYAIKNGMFNQPDGKGCKVPDGCMQVNKDFCSKPENTGKESCKHFSLCTVDSYFIHSNGACYKKMKKSDGTECGSLKVNRWDSDYAECKGATFPEEVTMEGTGEYKMAKTCDKNTCQERMKITVNKTKIDDSSSTGDESFEWYYTNPSNCDKIFSEEKDNGGCGGEAPKSVPYLPRQVGNTYNCVPTGTVAWVSVKTDAKMTCVNDGGFVCKAAYQLPNGGEFCGWADVDSGYCKGMKPPSSSCTEDEYDKKVSSVADEKSCPQDKPIRVQECKVDLVCPAGQTNCESDQKVEDPSSARFTGEFACVTQVEALYSRCSTPINDIELAPGHLPGSLLQNLIKQTHAQEEVLAGEDYVYYFPEEGVHTVNLVGGGTVDLVASGSVGHRFYQNRDGVPGYQEPLDVNNPKSNEDLLIPPSVAVVSTTKTGNLNKIELKKGINIVSFNFVPNKGGEGEPLSSAEFLELVNTEGQNVSTITHFGAGQWESGNVYDFDEKRVKGLPFDLVFGKGYVLIAERDTTISVPGDAIKSPVPVAFSSGWNLVGIHGYQTQYTAKSLVNSINSVEGLKADNVTYYPTDRGMYQGFQLSDGQEYGQDFPIKPDLGYFVRVNDIKPECRSIWWNPDGEYNGQCSN